MKLTGWYLPNQKPVRVGVYERHYGPVTLYCKWDGKKWSGGAKKMSAGGSWGETSFLALPWRGVAK